MEEPRYATFTLKIPKTNFIWIHEHPLINPFVGADKETKTMLWQSTPNIINFQFGGKNGTQFRELSEVSSFLEAFNKLFNEKKFDKKHLHPLLCIIGFLYQDFEEQSQEMNLQNELKESVNFILNLVNMCASHIEAMQKDESYEVLWDPYIMEPFFAKKELVKSMSFEDLVEYYPVGIKKDDVVRYRKIDIVGKKLTVPNEFMYSIHGSKGCTNFDGELTEQLKIPMLIQERLFQVTLDTLIGKHKENYEMQKEAYESYKETWKKDKKNTGVDRILTAMEKELTVKQKAVENSFYHALLKPEIYLKDLRVFYKKSQSHKVSTSTSLKKIGEIVGDYLQEFKLINSNHEISKFLLKYFSLLKAFDKDISQSPTDCSEIYTTYNNLGESPDTVYNLMKDIWAEKERIKKAKPKIFSIDN
jgi:hypothetical protein